MMITLLIILALLVMTILVYFRIADHYNIIDKPNHRSSHTNITIRGGGIIFYFGLLFFWIFYGFHYPWLLMGASFIAAISFVDDIHPLSPKLRLLVQFLTIGLLLYQCGVWQWYWFIPALVLVAGVINIYNFMDGINGITSCYSLVVLAGLWYVDNAKYGQGIDFVDNHIFYTMALSLIVFCFFNFRKRAKCFAGDVGSVTIAYVLSFLLVNLIVTTGNFAYIIFLAVYGVDAIITIVHRVIRKEKLTEAHRSHTYQIMANELKIPHLVVSTIYALLQILVTVGLFVFAQYQCIYFVVAIVLLVGINLWLRHKYFYLHKAS